jgi:hypothetical protein
MPGIMAPCPGAGSIWHSLAVFIPSVMDAGLIPAASVLSWGASGLQRSSTVSGTISYSILMITEGYGERCEDRPSRGAKSEWVIRTIKMRRTHQSSSKPLGSQVISNDFYRAKKTS